MVRSAARASPDDASRRRANHEAPIRPRPSFETPRLGAAPQDEAVSDERLYAGGLELHRLAAAAGGNLVRVVEDELGLHLVGLVVHLGAEQEQHGLGVDQDLHALILDHLVGRTDLVGIFDRVGLTGAAAILDADAQADDLGISALGELADAR